MGFRYSSCATLILFGCSALILFILLEVHISSAIIRFDTVSSSSLQLDQSSRNTYNGGTDLDARSSYMQSVLAQTEEQCPVMKLAQNSSMDYFPFVTPVSTVTMRSSSSKHMDGTSQLRTMFPEILTQSPNVTHTYIASSLMHSSSLETAEAQHMDQKSTNVYIPPYINEYVNVPYAHENPASYTARSSVSVLYEKNLRSMYDGAMGEQSSLLFFLHVSSDHSVQSVYTFVMSIRENIPLNEQYYSIQQLPIIITLPVNLQFLLPSIVALLHEIDNVQIILVSEYAGNILKAIEPHIQATAARFAQHVPSITSLQIYGIHQAHVFTAKQAPIHDRMDQLSLREIRLLVSKKSFYGSQNTCFYSKLASSEWYGYSLFPGQRTYFHASSLLHYWSVQSKESPARPFYLRDRHESMVARMDVAECTMYSIYLSNPATRTPLFSDTAFSRPFAPHTSKVSSDAMPSTDKRLYLPLSPPSNIQDFAAIPFSFLQYYTKIDPLVSHSQQYSAGPGYSFTVQRLDQPSIWQYVDITHVTSEVPQSTLLESSYQLSLHGLGRQDKKQSLPNQLPLIQRYQQKVLFENFQIDSSFKATVPGLRPGCTMSHAQRQLLIATAPPLALSHTQILRTMTSEEISHDVISTLLRALPVAGSIASCMRIYIPQVQSKESSQQDHARMNQKNSARLLSESFASYLLPQYNTTLFLAKETILQSVGVLIPLYSTFGQVKAMSSSFFKATEHVTLLSSNSTYRVKLGSSPFDAFLESIYDSLNPIDTLQPVHLTVYLGISTKDKVYHHPQFLNDVYVQLTSKQPKHVDVKIQLITLHSFNNYYTTVYNEMAHLAYVDTMDTILMLRDDTMLVQKHWLKPTLEHFREQQTGLVFFSNQTTQNIPIMFSRAHVQMYRGLFHPIVKLMEGNAFFINQYSPDPTLVSFLDIHTQSITKNKYNHVDRTQVDIKVLTKLEQQRLHSFFQHNYPDYAKIYFELYEQHLLNTKTHTNHKQLHLS